jgi:hypothetical protein
MKTDKGAKAIPVPESRGQVRFPLLMNLDLVDNIQGVWAGNEILHTIKRLEVLCEVQREPLEVVYTLEGAQQGIGRLMVGPTWVEGLHDSVVLCEERSDRMNKGEGRAKEGLHAEDAADWVVSPREIYLHLEDRLGIQERRSGAPTLDQVELLVDALVLFHVGVSDGKGIAKATGLEWIGDDHCLLESGQVCEEVEIDNEFLSREDGINGKELATNLPLENHQPVTCRCASQCLPKWGKMVFAGNLGVVEEAWGSSQDATILLPWYAPSWFSPAEPGPDKQFAHFW